MANRDKKGIDLELLREMKDLIGTPSRMDVPVIPNNGKDRDSFADFTGGLRSNWIFIMALAAACMWIFNNVSATKNINNIQDTRIEATAKAIQELTNNLNAVNTKVDTQVTNQGSTNNEIIRRLDNVQKDIEIIKGK